MRKQQNQDYPKIYEPFSKLDTLLINLFTVYFTCWHWHNSHLILEIPPGNNHHYEFLKVTEWLSLQIWLARVLHCLHRTRTIFDTIKMTVARPFCRFEFKVTSSFIHIASPSSHRLTVWKQQWIQWNPWKGMERGNSGPCCIWKQSTCLACQGCCLTLCILLVKSWPPAKLQLKFTGQGFCLIKQLAPDLQLFCTACWHCCTSADCVVNYIDDILSTHLLIDMWEKIIDL